MVKLLKPEETKAAMQDQITTEFIPVPASELPQTLPASQLEESAAKESKEQQSGFWDKQTVEAFIGTIGGLLQAYSKRATEILERRKAYLAEATAPILNKYVQTGWGMEINAALAWSLVGFEIYQEIRKEKEEKQAKEAKPA